MNENFWARFWGPLSKTKKPIVSRGAIFPWQVVLTIRRGDFRRRFDFWAFCGKITCLAHNLPSADHYDDEVYVDVIVVYMERKWAFIFGKIQLLMVSGPVRPTILKRIVWVCLQQEGRQVPNDEIKSDAFLKVHSDSLHILKHRATSSFPICLKICDSSMSIYKRSIFIMDKALSTVALYAFHFDTQKKK